MLKQIYVKLLHTVYTLHLYKIIYFNMLYYIKYNIEHCHITACS